MPLDTRVVGLHISQALRKVSDAVNGELRSAGDCRDLLALERYLRDALGVATGLQEVED